MRDESEDRPVKQVIVIRRDLGMRRGKEIAQGAHASMAWLTRRILWDAPGLRGEVLVTLPEADWLQGAFTKVVCQVPDEDALGEVMMAAAAAGVQAHPVMDAGRTEFGGQATFTAVAVGPDYADLVDTVTGHLALY